MLVGIFNGAIQSYAWYRTNVTWAIPAGRTMGSAQFVIPRDSPVWADGVLRRDGGQLIRIYDGAQVWSGISDSPSWSYDGAQISVVEVGQWVGRRDLHRRRSFRSVPAGEIAKAAITDAFIGTATLPVTVGPIALCPPLLSYEFTGKENTATVLNWLQDRTGQEWIIDHENYEFRWQMQVGRYHEGIVVDLGELFREVKTTEITERYQQVTEVDERTRRSFTAWNGATPPLWPSQKTLEV